MLESYKCEDILYHVNRLRHEGSSQDADRLLEDYVRKREGEVEREIVWEVWRSGQAILLEGVSEGNSEGSLIAKSLLLADRDGIFNLPEGITEVERLRLGVWLCLLTNRNPEPYFKSLKSYLQTTPSDYALQVRVYLSYRDINKAQEVLNRSIFKHPRDGELLGLQGVILLSLKKFDQAKAVLNRALSFFSREATIYTNLCRISLIQGSIDEAINFARAALRYRPWYDPPVQLISKALYDKREYGRLISWLNEVIDLYPKPSRLAARLDVLLMTGANAETLIREAERALQKAPDDPYVLLSSGNIFARAKELDRAISCYSKRLSIIPEDTSVRANLAQLKWEAGDVEGALREWRALGNKCPVEALPNFGDALLRLGRFKEALEVYNRAIEKSGDNVRAWVGLSRAHLGLGNLGEALKTAEKALNSDRISPYGWLALSDVLVAQGKGDEAERILLEGLSVAKPAYPLQERLLHLWRDTLKAKERLRRIAEWVEAEPNSVRLLKMLAEAAEEAGEDKVLNQVIKRIESIDYLTGELIRLKHAVKRDSHNDVVEIAERLVANFKTNLQVLKEVIRALIAVGNAERALSLFPKKEDDLNEIVKTELRQLKLSALSHLERWEEVYEEGYRAIKDKPTLGILELWLQSCRVLGKLEETFLRLKELPLTRLTLLCQVKLMELLGNYEDALKLLEAQLREFGEDLEIASLYVSMLSKVRPIEEAISFLEHIGRKLGMAPRILVAKGEAYLIAEDFTNAALSFEEALKLEPNSLEFAKRAADAWRRAGDREREYEAVIRIINKFPVESWAEWLLPHVERLGLVNRLEQELQRWHVSEPGNPKPLWIAFRFNASLRRFHEALRLLDVIERRQPKSAQVWMARANCLNELWRMSEAIEAGKRAVELAPTSPKMLVDLLNIQAKAGDFSGFDNTWDALKRLLGPKRYEYYVNFFFAINCHPSLSAEEIYRFHEEWYEYALKPKVKPYMEWENSPDPDRKLRIGYLSPDFRRHAVAYFSEPYLLGHDRENFEIFAFAELKPGAADTWTERFRSYVHHWIETFGRTDKEIAEIVRRLKIDILVDMAGHTADNRLGVLALKPAPVQLSVVFGAGQTTGIKEVDWFLCDSECCPPEHDKFMAERVWRLPFAGLPYRPPEDAPKPEPIPCMTRKEIILGVLARPIRVSPQAIRVWSMILKEVPEAKLRFDHVPYESLDVQERIVFLFEKEGVGRDRLIFKNTRPHWRAYQEIDLYLDTFPAGSGTTVTEALWMERVAVSLRSRPIMGRAGGAQIIALGLDDYCLAQSEEEYVAKAVNLLKNRELLAKLSEGLRESFRKSYLMDYARYGRCVSEALREMWRDWCKKVK